MTNSQLTDADHVSSNRRLLVVSMFLPTEPKPVSFTPSLPKTSNHLSKTASNSFIYSLNQKIETATKSTSRGNPGLYNAVKSTDLPHVWIGTLGESTQLLSDKERKEMQGKMWEASKVPVFVSDVEMEGHYSQFCKQVLWKPFHYQLDDHHKSQYEEQAWKHYQKVNQIFAYTIAKVYKLGDIVWINDYHLMLVPQMVRALIPEAMIGFFLHIPFPSSEIFRCLYVRKEILRGLLGADLIGFQTYAFMRHFLMTCSRLMGLDSSDNSIQLENSTVVVGIYPIGIDLASLNKKRQDPEVLTLIASLNEKYAGKKVLIGRDKNDHVKGVRHKLVAYERFLAQHPEWVGNVVLIQVSLSTTEANENESNVSDVVARINSKYGTIEYSPVVYLHQDISFSHYLALLTIADACLITPLRDGMNLTSHEYVVCQEEKNSPLIISEFAGTYGSFGAALRVNPWDAQEVADAIHEALIIGQEDRENRWQVLLNHVKGNTAQRYVSTFVEDICRKHLENLTTISTSIPRINFTTDVLPDYVAASRRIFFLDDCGTLRPSYTDQDTLQCGDDEMKRVLSSLCSDPLNVVYLMSGRRRQDLEIFSSIQPLGISAENGCFLKHAGRHKWEAMLHDHNLQWRKNVLEIFEYYTDRTPGSFIESKEVNLAWHYGFADSGFGSWQAAECQNHISNTLISLYPIHTLATKKRIEVMPRNVSKATIMRRVLQHHQGRVRRNSTSYAQSQETASTFMPPSSLPGIQHSSLFSPDVEPHVDHNISSGHLSDSSNSSHFNREHFDFILCIGDDRNDEVMFEYLDRVQVESNKSILPSLAADSPSRDACLSSPRSEYQMPIPEEHEEESTSSNRDRSTSSHPSNKFMPLKFPRNIYTCTVGLKSSAANWYIGSVHDVLKGLEELTTAK